jgi:PAS domain S-box-containing protein
VRNQSEPPETPEPSRRRPLTLGQALGVFLLVCLVAPLCTSYLWMYVQSGRQVTRAALRDVDNVASVAALRIESNVQRTRSTFVSAVLGDPRLATLARLLPTTDGEVHRRVVEELGAVQARAQGVVRVRDIRILSPNGDVLASTGAPHGSGTDASTLACVEKAGDLPTIAGVSYEGAEPAVLVASTIEGEDGGGRRIVCARVPLDVAHELLAAGRRPPHGSLYVVNERGTIVSVSGADEGATPDRRPFLTRGRAATPLGRAWEGRYVLPSGGEALAAYAPVPSLGWGVVAEVPVAAWLGALRRPELEAALAAIAIIGIVGMAAAWGLRTVVRPLQSLSRATERMVSGRAGGPVTPEGPREVAQLAAAFNHMSHALFESQQVLERGIAERTREVQDSREFVELLLNSIDHGVMVVDQSYRIVKANTAAIRAHGAGLVGSSYFETCPAREDSREECAVARTFASGQPASEERSRQMNGRRDAVKVETYPVFGDENQVRSVVEVTRTVTAEKQLQMQRMYQEKMAAFGLLAAGLAHDIGNPLAAIESQLQVARQQPGRRDETLAVVGKEVGRIARMLREIIDFARRRRDAVALVSVNQVIEDVTRIVKHDPRGHAVRIAHRLDADLPGIRTTEDQLFQVFLNLGLNALDAMPAGGTLEFESSFRGGWVAVRVTDTGSGIPDELRPHLFEPFFTSKAADRGSGLGLFTSKGIVEGMGGGLMLERSDRRGTTFAVLLPVTLEGDASR